MPMKLRHIISAQQFDKTTLEKIFRITDKIKKGNYRRNSLNGKIMATLFYEPSTRTRFSFESAMLRLGGSVISTENAREFSSVAKGETLEDTIRVVNHYCDLIVFRHYQPGAAEKAAKFSKVPLINAGDGTREHPTQAILDLYTIFTKFKKPNLPITLIGDLAKYRSIHSLIYLLLLYPKIKFILVSPKSLSILPAFRKNLVEDKSSFKETEDLNVALKEADVIYKTRIQKERLTKAEYKKYFGKYIIDKTSLKLMKKKALIMHALPRVNEISCEVDSDPRAIYFEEAQNGLYTRMALLTMLFAKAKSKPA